MLIPPHIIDQVRSQANIVDIVGERVQLRKAGRNYLGLCPFHKEKSPSFNVNAERGIFKCFGCGKAGNVITFVEEIDKLGFVDAVRALAQKLGIVIPEEDRADPTGIHARRDAALAALRAAVEFYHQLMSGPDGASVRDYLTRRGFSPEVMESFALGASPAGWDRLMNHLAANGYTNEQLNDAGLIVIREDGRTYDRFRGRAMFAIRDEYGRTVGFSARGIDGDTQPKYVNSPQGIVFDKSRVLYALDMAKRAMADQRVAVIVEGQADVVMMHQHGFTNTVATSGTALTEDHLRLLKKHADTMVLLFDADTAGQNATTRAIEMGLAAGFDVKCVQLPAGSDPDSLLRTQGREAMQTLLTDPPSWLAFQAERYRLLGALDDAVQQARAVRTMLTWIASVPEALRKPFLARELASAFRLDEGFLLRELDAMQPGGGALARRDTAVRLHTEPPASPAKQPLATPAETVHSAERELFKHVLWFEDGASFLLTRQNILTQQNISENDLVTESGKRIFRRIIVNEAEHHEVIQPLLNDDELTPEERHFLASLCYDILALSKNWEKFGAEVIPYEIGRPIYDACITLLITQYRSEVLERVRQLHTIADEEERNRIYYRINLLEQKRIQLHWKQTQDTEYAQWLLADTPYLS